MANFSVLLKQLQVEKGRIEGQLQQLDGAINLIRELSGNSRSAVKSIAARPHRVLSVAARKRIAAAQKLRWAKWKAKQAKAA